MAGCDDCLWKAKGEIALHICTHGARCTVHVVAACIHTEARHVHPTEHRLHWHLPDAWHFWHAKEKTGGAG